MAHLSWAELRDIAHNVGHTPRVQETRRGWAGTCTCGFRSARTPDQATSENLVAEHIVKAAWREMQKQRASGRLPV